jgi:uncharacterized membrane protein YgcG
MLAFMFALLMSVASALEPSFVPGENVYAVPAREHFQGFPSGWEQEMEATLDALHYPYYVIVIDELPPERTIPTWAALGITERGSYEDHDDEVLARYITAIKSEWASKGYDMGKSSLFVLSFNPRKYRYDAGSTFTADLGFKNSAHKQYTDIFLRRAKAKDPEQGILDMATAVDGYLWDMTDPVKVAARKAAAEAEARAEAARQAAARLQSARDGLTDQSRRIEEMLAAGPAFLPANTSASQAVVTRAREIVVGSDIPLITTYTKTAKAEADRLAVFYDEKVSAARAATLWTTFKWGSIFGLFGLLAFLAAGRRRSLSDALTAFGEDYAEWAKKVENAEGQLASFTVATFDVRDLAATVGSTKTLYNEVTTEIDSIRVSLAGLAKHVAACRALADTATFFNPTPATTAREMIGGTFDFDTGEVNASDLFGSDTRVIKVDANDFIKGLADRFVKAMAKWDVLLRAGKVRLSPLSLPADTYLAMVGLAKSANIPARWYADHPLMDGATTEAALHAKRQSDPVDYIRTFDVAVAKCREVETRVSTVATIVRSVKQAGEFTLTADLSVTTVPENMNPAKTLATAKAAEAAFYGLLSTDTTIDDLKASARKVADLYSRAAREEGEIVHAIKTAETSVTKAKAAFVSLDDVIAQVTKRVKAAGKVHANTGTLVDACKEFEVRKAEIGETLTRAIDSLKRKLHTEAEVGAGTVLTKVKSLVGSIKATDDAVTALDRAKAEYEATMSNMGSTYEARQRDLKKYKSRKALRTWQTNTTSGVLDYAILLAEANRVQQEWDAQVRTARRAVEEAEAAAQRRRDEEERAERRRRDDEDRRRRDDSSGGGWGGSSSSSGSSWGGSDSSSGGSSGGSDSSSGGSW